MGSQCRRDGVVGFQADVAVKEGRLRREKTPEVMQPGLLCLWVNGLDQWKRWRLRECEGIR